MANTYTQMIDMSSNLQCDIIGSDMPPLRAEISFRPFLQTWRSYGAERQAP